MKDSQRYAKMVEWSEEDECYVGSCPELFFGGCHGPDEVEVFRELCDLVDEVISRSKAAGDPLPEPTPGREVADPLPRMTRANASGTSQANS